MNKAVFLDRDGVITQEPPHYAYRLDQLALIPGSGDAIRLLNNDGYKVVVVSNQSGIGRGYYQEVDTELFNQALRGELAKLEAHLDAIYYCPHHPEAEVEEYRMNCNCRKPEPGMLIMAGNDLEIDMKRSFLVGDKLTDIEAGKRVGCKTILVKTGFGAEQLKDNRIDCEYIADDLFQAVEYILDSSHSPGMSGKASARREN